MIVVDSYISIFVATALFCFALIILLAPNVVLSLMNAQGEITNASILLTGLEMHLNQMDYVIDTLIEKTTSIRNTSSKGITMMNDAHVNGK